MLTSEQHRCHNEGKKKFQRRVSTRIAQLVVDQNYTVADAASAMDVGLSNDAMGETTCDERQGKTPKASPHYPEQ
jgi:hypothetical protein